MKQETEQYRSQYEVFFLATLVLFPNKLMARPLDPWFFRPYFNFIYDNKFTNGKNLSLDWVVTILDDYQNKGYIKYDAADSLFKITKVNTEKAADDLMQYLKRWQRDGLLALSANKPPDATRQKELLLAAIADDFRDHKNEQRITLENVYGEPSNYAYAPPFWELLLTYQLLDKKIKITYMDYGRRDDGLYDDGSQPTVDVKITDKELISRIEQQVAPVPPPARASIVVAKPQNKPRGYDELQSVAITMSTEGVVSAELGDEKHLIKRLRRDSAPYNFMNYMLGHQKQDIPRGVIQSDVDGCTAKENMTELAKACGFTKELLPLKATYFGGTTKLKVHFKATANLTPRQIELLAKCAIV